MRYNLPIIKYSMPKAQKTIYPSPKIKFKLTDRDMFLNMSLQDSSAFAGSDDGFSKV